MTYQYTSSEQMQVDATAVENATLRSTIRALRLAILQMRGTMIGLYSTTGMCILVEGMPATGVRAREGRHYTEFVPVERREVFERMFQAACEGVETEEDYPIDERLYRAIAKPVFSGSGVVDTVSFFVRDISDERDALRGQQIRAATPAIGPVVEMIEDGLMRHGPSSQPPLFHDAVDTPLHYTSSDARCRTCGDPIECIDITSTMSFLRGNALKYLWRAGLKGDAIEDLKKAARYISHEIQKLLRDAAR